VARRVNRSPLAMWAVLITPMNKTVLSRLLMQSVNMSSSHEVNLSVKSGVLKSQRAPLGVKVPRRNFPSRLITYWGQIECRLYRHTVLSLIGESVWGQGAVASSHNNLAGEQALQRNREFP
jgi:hypothetical protein